MFESNFFCGFLFLGLPGKDGHLGNPGSMGLPGFKGGPGNQGPDGYDGIGGPDGPPGSVGNGEDNFLCKLEHWLFNRPSKTSLNQCNLLLIKVVMLLFQCLV